MVGRNDPCPCGSGKKYKKCCYSSKNEQVNQVLSSLNIDYGKLVQKFEELGIDTSKPGFYDEASFIAVERVNSDFLNQYAAFVTSKEYTAEYLDHAEQKIPVIAKSLFDELKKEGRRGACADISMLLSRCLEKEGFWNYCAIGSLTIQFDSKVGIRNKYFWAVDTNMDPKAVAHAWVVAPPFTVIDLSVGIQPYHDGEEVYLPEYVISKTKVFALYSVDDIIAPNVRAILFRQGYMSDTSMLHNTIPHALPIIEKFLPRKVTAEHATLKYITIAVRAPDCPLENMANITLNGMSPYETYQKVVKPTLDKIQY